MVAGWFARFPAEIESREDAYLVNPVRARIRGGLAQWHGTDTDASRSCAEWLGHQPGSESDASP